MKLGRKIDKIQVVNLDKNAYKSNELFKKYLKAYATLACLKIFAIIFANISVGWIAVIITDRRTGA